MPGLELGQRDEEPLERLTGIGVLERRERATQQRLVHRREHGLDERLLRREVAAHRAHADAGATGNLLDLTLEARLAEHLLGRGEHPLAVAAGVGPLRAGRRPRSQESRFKRKHDSDYTPHPEPRFHF